MLPKTVALATYGCGALKTWLVWVLFSAFFPSSILRGRSGHYVSLPQGHKDHFAVSVNLSSLRAHPGWKGKTVMEWRPLCSSRIPVQLRGCTPPCPVPSSPAAPHCDQCPAPWLHPRSGRTSEDGTQEAVSQAAQQNTQDSTPDQPGSLA